MAKDVRIISVSAPERVNPKKWMLELTYHKEFFTVKVFKAQTLPELLRDVADFVEGM